MKRIRSLLTCGVCAYRQWVVFTIIADGEETPQPCENCGESSWLAFPIIVELRDLKDPFGTGRMSPLEQHPAFGNRDPYDWEDDSDSDWWDGE